VATEQIAPPTNAERIARIRADSALPSDLDWLRVTRHESNGETARSRPYSFLICACRCSCHRSSAPPATGAPAGTCGLTVDLADLDCYRACRSSHMLAGHCTLDGDA
jgi:hypothetical protein